MALRQTLAAAVFALPLTAAVFTAAAAEPTWYVRAGAVSCGVPDNVNEALAAAVSRDERWLEQVDCGLVQHQQPVVILQDPPYGPWQVRLLGYRLTAWVPRSTLQTAAGVPLSEYRERGFDALLTRLTTGQAPF